jgi:hypothetical protein
MTRPFIVALSLGLTAVLLFANGCAKQPQATPEATPTENVVVVVVTATTQATFAATETGEPTITPLATFTPLGLNSPTATTRASATVAPAKTAANTPRAARTNSPVVTNAAPTAAPFQNKYTAPAALSPTEGDSFRDGSDIQFYFAAVGPLGANECYLLHVDMINPNATSGGVAGDEFLDSAHCGDQSPSGTRLKYVVFRSKYTNAPNYGTIESQSARAAPTDLLKVRWYVRVVQNSGSEGVHHNVSFLSPASAILECDFFP